MTNNIEKMKTLLKLSNIKYYYWCVPPMAFHGDKISPTTYSMFQVDEPIDSLLHEAAIPFQKAEYDYNHLDTNVKSYHYAIKDE